MEPDENDNDIKEVVESKDLLKIPINYEGKNYLLKIFPSKDNISIIFKLEKEKAQTYYYYAKYDFRAFKQINKKFNTDKNIYNVFLRLKEITQSSQCNIERKSMKIDIYFTRKNTEFSVNFTVKKKIVAQNRLNFQLIELIQENKAKIKIMKKQLAKFDKLIQNKNEIIDNINNQVDKITSTVNILNANVNNNDNIDSDNSKSNSISSFDISSKNSDISSNSKEKEKDKEFDLGKKYIINEKENILLKKNLSSNGEENKKKNEEEKEGNKNINNDKQLNNKNKNDERAKMKFSQEETLFCFENIDVFRNKKIFETLIVFNVITILIIMYLLCSVYALRSNLTFDKIRDQEMMKKMAFLSLLEDPGDDEVGGMRENIVDFQLKNNDNNRNNDDEETPYNNNNNNQKVRYAIIRKRPKDSNKEVSLLTDEKEKKYFKKRIKRKLRFRIKDMNFNLVYNSRDSYKYRSFFNNYKELSEILLFIKTKSGVKFCVFSSSIILYEKNIENIEGNYAGYIYGHEQIIENELNEFISHYRKYFKSVYDFLEKENLNFIKNKNNTNTQIHGDIDFFEVYQVIFVR